MNILPMRLGHAFVIMLLAGCGRPEFCATTPAPCGGEVIGTWRSVESCQTVSDECRLDGYREMTLAADGTSTYRWVGQTDKSVPPSCLHISCHAEPFPGSGGGINPVTLCPMRADGSCACSLHRSDAVAAGTWTTHGTELTVTGMSVLAYCVSGNHLFTNETGIRAGQDWAAGNAVYERQ